MTAPDPADVIEAAAKVLRAYLSTPTAIHAARALHDAGLLLKVTPCAEVARLRDGAAELAESWRRETANEFAVAASDLDELVNDPEPRQALTMAVAELRATVARVRGLTNESRVHHHVCDDGLGEVVVEQGECIDLDDLLAALDDPQEQP